MASYLINKGHHDDSVVRLESTDGYKFKPKVQKDKYIKVNEVTIVDRKMIDQILSVKFDKSFKRVVAMALAVINDEESDETACEVVLDEVELVRQVLLNRYQKFLNYEKEQLFLKKLRLIEFEADSGYKVGLFRGKEASEEMSEMVNKTITFTGYFADINGDDFYKLTGNYVFNERYGNQFQVSSYEREEPKGKDAVIAFLSSPLVKGCGEKTAIQIVDTLYPLSASNRRRSFNIN